MDKFVTVRKKSVTTQDTRKPVTPLPMREDSPRKPVTPHTVTEDTPRKPVTPHTVTEDTPRKPVTPREPVTPHTVAGPDWINVGNITLKDEEKKYSVSTKCLAE